MARTLNNPSALFAYLLSRSALVALILAAGCQIDDSIEGEHYVVEVHSDEPLDQLVVYDGQKCHDCTVPLTPKMIADGVTTPSGTVYFGTGRVIALDHPVTEYTLDRWEVFGFTWPLKVLVLGYRRDAGGQLVLVSEASVVPAFSSGGTYTGSMELTGALVPGIEVWGAKHCAAVGNEMFVDHFDVDCDGFGNDDDCNEGIYCDPAAASPAARAACQATTCAPCIGEINGACSLGTQAVCHDGTGTARSYTCEASATCGDATCLPAGACQLDCSSTWPESDPIPCLLNMWKSAQTADAVNCRIPAMGATGHEVPCAAGSAIEVALPYTSCANAELILGLGLDGEIWTATITPSCTLHVEFTGTYVFDTRSIIAAFEAGSSTQTVRLILAAQAGTCGTIGTCDPVPAAALCSP